MELILRVLVELLFHGVGEWLWWWFRASGAVAVWVLTFGRIDLMERNEVLAGIAGIILHIVIISLVIGSIISEPAVAP